MLNRLVSILYISLYFSSHLVPFPVSTSIFLSSLQSKRDRVIRDFRNGNSRILVATDVAARGLDIPVIKHVINYDLPQVPEDYIH